MITRAQRKQETRQALMDAALSLSADGHSIASLGLREVTRACGVSPAAFYIHFRDLEELALAVVDDMCYVLRRKMREIRRATPRPENAVQGSVEDFLAFYKSHRRAVDFVARERIGGTPRMRQAIAREIALLTDDLTNDLRYLPLLKPWPDTDIDALSRLLVSTVISFFSDIVVMPEKSPDAVEPRAHQLIRELRLILVGARHWDPARAKPIGAKSNNAAAQKPPAKRKPA